MRIVGLTMFLCAVALAGCATGGSSGPGSSEPVRALLSADVMLFVSFDADGDLRVTAAEIEAGLNREFARADANGDGQMQPLEFQNWANIALGGGRMGPYRLELDRNVDNVITREEFETELRARARDYDADEDGVLMRPEFVRVLGQTRALPGPSGAGSTPR